MSLIIIKNLGLKEYDKVYKDMINFTNHRINTHHDDELWLVQHPSIFTQGMNGSSKHIIDLNNIPIIKTDRGGQVTYHAPGQAIIYFLFNLKRLSITIKSFIKYIEHCCIQLLKKYNIHAYTILNTPGIYVNNKKIASIGLRVKKRYTYHGIAINNNLDLTPFTYIHPCGNKTIKMTKIHDYRDNIKTSMVLKDYADLVTNVFNFL